MGALYLEVSLFRQAIDQLEALAVMADSDAQSLAELAYGYARAGRLDRAHRLLARIEAGREQWYAPELYLALGDTGRAIAIVQRAFQAGPSGFLLFRCTPLYRELKAEPRIQELVHRLRFPEAPGDSPTGVNGTRP